MFNITHEDYHHKTISFVKITIFYSRYNLRPVTDDEIQIANGRIDEKIARRRQQQYEQEQKSKQPQPQPQQQTTKSTPAHSSPSSTSDSSRPLMNSSAPSSNDEEYSVFRDPPASASLPATTRVIFLSSFL